MVDDAQRFPRIGVAREIPGQRARRQFCRVVPRLADQRGDLAQFVVDRCATLQAREALRQRVDRCALQAVLAAQREGVARGLQLAGVEQDVGVGKPVALLGRIALQRRRQVRGGSGQVGRLPLQQAELVMRFRMAGLHVEYGAAQRGRLVQFAGSDVLQGALHGLGGDAVDFFGEGRSGDVLHGSVSVAGLETAGLTVSLCYLATLVQGGAGVKGVGRRGSVH